MNWSKHRHRDLAFALNGRPALVKEWAAAMPPVVDPQYLRPAEERALIYTLVRQESFRQAVRRVHIEPPDDEDERLVAKWFVQDLNFRGHLPTKYLTLRERTQKVVRRGFVTVVRAVVVLLAWFLALFGRVFATVGQRRWWQSGRRWQYELGTALVALVAALAGFYYGRVAGQQIERAYWLHRPAVLRPADCQRDIGYCAKYLEEYLGPDPRFRQECSRRIPCPPPDD